ncbi:hypothetical protein LOC68_17420 [Blastopirellula sp. JC732]|uniref:Uncharacterized protein n=1 Tax=Blastopirellula sediminis TaxID=2894196 RepID=A0A9X1SHI6_9BACT|nr:hypothetical protein [Blastopirellula sediminis]MCC9606525.1 hypothetical protein [Blastopirellula sediminis]MCC9630177.1 hypothetical protein [Blastopirellula sediminis]
MNIQSWGSAVKRLLGELQDIDFGTPLGENVLHEPQPADDVQKCIDQIGLQDGKKLAEFYTYCDGLSWPDVHVGYFISPIARLAEVQNGDPTTIVGGSNAGDVQLIGSDGGGRLFVMRKEEQDVLVLPPGEIVDGKYDDSAERSIWVAIDLKTFLVMLHDDLKAFVLDTPDHSFLGS